MKNLYMDKYNEYFKDILELDFDEKLYSFLNHRRELNADEYKERIFVLENVIGDLKIKTEALKLIGDIFVEDIVNEYPDREMDFVEFFQLVLDKAKEKADPELKANRDVINAIDYKTTVNFHPIEILYHNHDKEDDTEHKTLKVLIDSIAEYEHSIQEHNFFKTIIYSRYVQEHIVHFVEERVKKLEKDNEIFVKIHELIENNKSHSLGVQRTSLPDLLNIFLRNNMHISGHHLPQSEITHLNKESHSLWKVSSYFIHAGNTILATNFKVDDFHESFRLIRVDGLKFIHDILHYLLSILFGEEWKDIYRILSSSPLEFSKLVYINEWSVPKLFSEDKDESIVLSKKSFIKDGLYERLTQEQQDIINEEYQVSDHRFKNESKDDMYDRLFAYFDDKYDESNDLFEKTILLRRNVEVVASRLVSFHEHFKGYKEFGDVRNEVNGLFHIDYLDLEESGFSQVVPKGLNMENVDRLNNGLMESYKHLWSEHKAHLRNNKNRWVK